MNKFEKKESYKHKLAIKVLDSWVNELYLRTQIEDQFCMAGIIWFVSDLTCYDENGLSVIYEVVHKNPVNIFKQWRMNFYFDIHKWEGIRVYEINADWILNQTKKPNYLNANQIL